MTDDQQGEGAAPRGGGRWDPLPQGDYDDGATAFVKLPEGGIDALLASADSPLAAPGHGYVPPQITVTPATTAGTDPAATGAWATPADGTRWQQAPDAGGQAAAQRFPGQEYAGQEYAGQEYGGRAYAAPAEPDAYPGQVPYQDRNGHGGQGGYPAQDPYGQPGQARQPGQPGRAGHGGQDGHGGGQDRHGGGQAGHGGGQPGRPAADVGHDDRFAYHPDASGQWDLGGEAPASAPGPDAAGRGAAEPGPNGPWSIPLADGDLPDDSGEFTTSSLAGQWSGGAAPPATLPGGAAAPWAPQPAGQPWDERERERPGALPDAGPRTDGRGEALVREETPTASPSPTPAEAGAAGAVREAMGLGGPGGPGGHGGTEGTVGAGGAAAAAGARGPGEAGALGAAGETGAPGGSAGPGGANAAGVPGAPGVPAGSGRQGESGAPGAPGESREAAGNGGPRGPEGSQKAPEAPVAPSAAPVRHSEAESGPEAAQPPVTDPAPAAARTASAGEPAAEAGGAARPGAGASAEPAPGPEPAADPGPVRQDGSLGAHDEHPLASYVLRVNGADRPVTDAWIGESLLYVLRERLGLAGAKDGCSQGECGACNVQVDGRLVASCLVPAVTAAGSEVRTVEGLATDGRPSDVQRALARCGAVQCGFCVPGMAMTVHNLLEGNPAPTELETRQALCGNLCRCSGYRGFLEAVREVVAERAAEAEEDEGADPGEDDGARIPHQAGPGAGGVNPSAFDPAPRSAAPDPHGRPPHDQAPRDGQPPYDQPYDQPPYGQDGGQA
ncbi:2Fe-2S iron-sulfur cluster-binding protein [Streptomyces tagetis]|uniref:2Fe-2S ferredoxin-type domain-containing protein n=1 Tax=Streptomyces tagetis TaxID=2820809 RepID=A0A940XMB5_9ACTN|nr:2Fe-2S iron-sulfur cluster-binding protein [Streptomyces sp. RG38]MBQ0828996.1 hypothetical protein [Streptomyces sp. RG38]